VNTLPNGARRVGRGHEDDRGTRALTLGVAVGVVQPGTDGAITTSIFFFGQLTDQNDNPIPLDGATDFEIGSVTKTFTATVLASLIQEQPTLVNLNQKRSADGLKGGLCRHALFLGQQRLDEDRSRL
jgi:CubicO group peptidase (beta-lactamase class C family)